MILAAVGDTGYNIVLVLHILTALAAFAPVFAHPFIVEQSKQLDSGARGQVIGFLVQNGRRVYLPALVVTGILGFGLVGMSSDVFELTQGWVIASIIIWIAMNGILHAVVVPGEKAMIDGDDAAESRVAAGGITVTVLLIVMIYLMVFKPGLG